MQAQREQGQLLTLDTAEFNAKQQLLRKLENTKMLKDTTQNQDIEINIYKNLYNTATFAKLRTEN